MVFSLFSSTFFWVVSLLFFCILPQASAQRSFIGFPADGSKIHLGKAFTVQVIRPNSIQGSREVGIVIGLQSCPVTNPFPCAPPSQQVGSVLFIGKFDPVLHEQPGRPYQNFTVSIAKDSGFPKGRAQLSVSRFHLIGAGPSPVLEFNNITLKVC